MKQAFNPVESVLVTGGTGTFGQAFISFLLSQSDIKRIVVFSRGEHTQAAMRQQLGNDERLRWFIGDVRDLDRLTRAMQGVDTVVHAAALKRIETGAYNPDEMVKTNVLGTMNVCQAAANAHCRRVVGLSSDKAYQPVSPYGQSKALAESVLLASNGLYGFGGPRFAATRYGNVWNAQGSVLPTWLSMLERQDRELFPLPVTDPDCTRFFMTIGEAVDMVWNTMRNMQGGELVIPEWLPAYRLGDLVLALGCRHMDIRGLPAWEKLHESMRDGLCSVDARRMSIDELREKLKNA